MGRRVTVLVDSSVWIAYLRDSGGPEVDLLERLIDEQRAATTDVVLLEVLAGTTDEERAAREAGDHGRAAGAGLRHPRG